MSTGSRYVFAGKAGLRRGYTVYHLDSGILSAYCDYSEGCTETDLREVQPGQAVGVGGGTEDHRAGLRAQGVDALDVVVVVVGDQDVGQPPLVGVQGGKDGAGLGDVDHGGLAGIGVVDQVGVIVGQAGNGDEVEHGL